MSRPRREDCGSASIWVLTAGALVIAIALATALRCTAVLARHRAETAADLAALAAAGRLGIDGSSCHAARHVASVNGARLASCQVALDATGRGGTVIIRVVTEVSLPLIGVRTVSASARAGR